MIDQNPSALDPKINSYYLKTFSGMDVAGQTLQDIEFEACTFIKCDFSDATLRGFRFIDCSFTDCTLSHVKLPSSRFRSVSFERCLIVDINWTVLEWSRLSTSAELSFRDCTLTDSIFFGLHLDELVMQNCKARSVDLREASLKKADVSYTDFYGALFGKSNLTDADFTESTGFDIDVLNNVMTRSKFSRYEAVRLLSGLDIEVVD
ncbi:pentapeptide repeat-containing protein [Isoptericola jiangsuensis]|uniref:pentapeptide repeat-containing protein n=1 Tax=Isoptericola jiangsuensis TaxID=548579 RepID=UPI0038681DD2